jgi:PEP-CTERM motif
LKHLLGKRRKHHRALHHRRRVLRIRILALGLLIVPILSAISLIRSLNSSVIIPAYHTSLQWSDNSSENLAILAGEASRYSGEWQSRRPVYTYSVIPGGVETADQLKTAVSADREVASHYAGFQYRKARIVTLNRPQLVYLSYRKNGTIYWTRTRHLLLAGERIITDGNIAARTRCANRISVQRRMAIAPEEPPAARLDEFALPPSLVPFPAHFESALSSPGSSPQPGPIGSGPIGLGGIGVFPPGLPSGSVCRPEKDCNKPPSGPSGPPKPPGPPGTPGAPSPPPATVPEPGSIVLFCSGAAAVYARLRKNKTQDRN